MVNPIIQYHNKEEAVVIAYRNFTPVITGQYESDMQAILKLKAS